MALDKSIDLNRNKLLWVAIGIDFLFQLVIATIVSNSDFFTPDNQSSGSYSYPLIMALLVFPLIIFLSIAWNIFQLGLLSYFIYSCSKLRFNISKDSNFQNLLSGLLFVLYIPLIIYKIIFVFLLFENGISDDSYKSVFPEKQGILIDVFYDK